MSLLPGHLGARTSALLDGQLSPAETERAWQHVGECPECAAEVEREAWLKQRLACLGDGSEAEAPASASERLKLELLAAARAPHIAPLPPLPRPVHRSRRAVALAAFGGGAVGAAFLGVLTVGAGPADAPAFQRHTPPSAVNTTVPVGTAVVHVRGKLGP